MRVHVETLARECRRTVKTVIVHLHDGEENGWIKSEWVRTPGKRGRHKVYTLTVPGAVKTACPVIPSESREATNVASSAAAEEASASVPVGEDAKDSKGLAEFRARWGPKLFPGEDRSRAPENDSGEGGVSDDEALQ